MNFQETYQKELDGLHASPETIETVRQIHLNGRQAARKRPHTVFRAICIAAAVLLLGTAAFAAVYRLWSPGMVALFGADEAAQETLLDSGMTSVIDSEPITLESGVTVQLQQVLCDGTEITLSLYFEAPEAGWMTDENMREAGLNALPVSTLTIGEKSFQSSGGGFKRSTATEYGVYATYSFYGDCSALDGQEAVLTYRPVTNLDAVIENVRKDDPERAETIASDPLIPRQAQEIHWTLDLSASISKILSGTYSAEYEGTTLSLSEITLTPVSIRFTLSAETAEELESLNSLYLTGVVLSDGSEIGLGSGMMGLTLNEDGEWGLYAVSEEEETDDTASRGYYSFDSTITDLDSIVGVTFASLQNKNPDGICTGETVFTIPLTD